MEKIAAPSNKNKNLLGKYELFTFDLPKGVWVLWARAVKIARAFLTLVK